MHVLSLNSCWLVTSVVNVRDELKFKELLTISEEYTVEAITVLGYPGRRSELRPRLLGEETSYEESE